MVAAGENLNMLGWKLRCSSLHQLLQLAGCESNLATQTLCSAYLPLLPLLLLFLLRGGLGLQDSLSEIQ
jgi:hypothetical protein